MMVPAFQIQSHDSGADSSADDSGCISKAPTESGVWIGDRGVRKILQSVNRCEGVGNLITEQRVLYARVDRFDRFPSHAIFVVGHGKRIEISYGDHGFGARQRKGESPSYGDARVDSSAFE